MLTNNSKRLINLTKNVFNQKPDFSWEFGGSDNDGENDRNYRLLLKRNYFYNELTYKLYVKNPMECITPA